MKVRSMTSVLAMAVAVSLASADDFSTSVGAKAKALLFTFQGLSFLGAGNFDGGIGAKFYLSNPVALRGSLQFANYNHTVAANPMAPATGTDGSDWAIRYGVSAALEYHLLPGRVSPYLGGGVSVSSTSTESKPSEVGTPPPAAPTTKNGGLPGFAPGMELAGGGLVGVEFFLSKEISLSAEYMLGYSLLSPYDREFINGAVTTTTKVGSTSNIDVSTAALTLAVYF